MTHRPGQSDCAVALCCDRKYFHLALFTIRQVAFHNPHRTFDFVIATQDDLEVPDWAKDYGIILHRTGRVPVAVEAARFNGSLAPLYRILLSRELGDRYRRILYLDCDMFVEGGDFNRLIETDIGPHPIAAALDAPFLYVANYRAREFIKAGLPAMPYANTGLQLIDTRAYRDQEVERRAFEVCRTHPDAVVYTDQSLTNLALRGGFAQLAPCWNWQWNFRLPLVPMRYPVFVRHFIGTFKPDRESSGRLDVRFNQAYRDFLTLFAPDLLANLAPACDPAPMGVTQILKLALVHVQTRGFAAAALARHPDPYKAIF